MAGPVATILLGAKDIDARASALRARVSCGDNTVGVDFTLEGRPFVMTIGPEYPEELPNLVEGGLVSALGWTPEQLVTFAAMCNGDQDHRLLAQLCIALCENTAGIVDIGGTLPIGPKLDPSIRAEALRIPNPDGLAGTLYASTYEVTDGSFGTTHFVDATLLRTWLAHPDFRMLK